MINFGSMTMRFAMHINENNDIIQQQSLCFCVFAKAHQARSTPSSGREKNDSAMAGPDVPSVPLERSDPWDFDQNYAARAGVVGECVIFLDTSP